MLSDEDRRRIEEAHRAELRSRLARLPNRDKPLKPPRSPMNRRTLIYLVFVLTVAAILFLVLDPVGRRWF